MINQTRYSSMNDRIAPGIWSPFVSTIIPSYHTSNRYLWKIIIIMICLFIPHPPVKRGRGGGLMKHTPPLKKSNFFDRAYSDHLLGFKVLTFQTVKWSTRKNSVGSFFWNRLLHFVKNLCLNFFKSSQQIYLLSINFSTGRPKLHNLVYGFNMHGQKC